MWTQRTCRVGRIEEAMAIEQLRLFVTRETLKKCLDRYVRRCLWVGVCGGWGHTHSQCGGWGDTHSQESLRRVLRPLHMHIDLLSLT